MTIPAAEAGCPSPSLLAVEWNSIADA